MVPEAVDAVEESGLVNGNGGLREEEVEEKGGDFALEVAQLGQVHNSGAWLGWCFCGLGFEDGLMAWWMLGGLGDRSMLVRCDGGGLRGYEGHAVCVGSLHSRCGSDVAVS